jgi:hypothetical protein
MNFIIEFQRFDCFGAFIEDFVFLVRIRCVLSMIERKIVGVHAYEVNGVFKGTLKNAFSSVLRPSGFSHSWIPAD